MKRFNDLPVNINYERLSPSHLILNDPKSNQKIYRREGNFSILSCLTHFGDLKPKTGFQRNRSVNCRRIVRNLKMEVTVYSWHTMSYIF